ncbi:MAG: sulfurtransferase TusA family protein [Alphaproteobacteria bacterium]|nr:sulfurtransferase TusA family protein [Alphaproteobacteria bacterium]
MKLHHPEMTLDLSGLLCPLPVLKARKALASLPKGAELVILATDPMAAIDMPHFCNEQGHMLLEQSKTGDTWHFRIKRHEL